MATWYKKKDAIYFSLFNPSLAAVTQLPQKSSINYHPHPCLTMKYIKSILLPVKLNSWHQVPARFRNIMVPFNDKHKILDNALHQIISEVKSERKYLNMIPNFEKIIQKTTQHNSRSGNNHIITTMLTSYNMIENPNNITAESFHKASVLAWAAQMVDSCNKVVRNVGNGHEKGLEQNFLEVADSTVEDADLLRSFIYAVIELNFQDTKWYRDFVQLYNKAFLFSAIGHYLEHSLRKQPNTSANLNANEYEKLCYYKVSFPVFELPLLLAMTLANKSNTELKSVRRICSEMGILYQIQADFKNCFGAEAIIGTGGTDIQNGKCTWLAVTALQRLTPRQRVVFDVCYGSEEPAHIERVKLLYEQIQLPRLYRERSGAFYESIMQQAKSLEKSGMPCKLFEELLETILIRIK